jgi:hypothetical protein
MRVTTISVFAFIGTMLHLGTCLHAGWYLLGMLPVYTPCYMATAYSYDVLTVGLGINTFPASKWNQFILHHMTFLVTIVIFLLFDTIFHWHLAMFALSSANEACLLLCVATGDTVQALRSVQKAVERVYISMIWPALRNSLLLTSAMSLYTVYSPVKFAQTI